LYLSFDNSNAKHLSVTWQYLLTAEYNWRWVSGQHPERSALRRIPQSAETAAACQQGQMVDRTSGRERFLQSQQEWYWWEHV